MSPAPAGGLYGMLVDAGVPVPTSLPSMKRRTVDPSNVPAALCHLPSHTEAGASGERNHWAPVPGAAET